MSQRTPLLAFGVFTAGYCGLAIGCGVPKVAPQIEPQIEEARTDPSPRIELPDELMLSHFPAWLEAELKPKIAGRECILVWGEGEEVAEPVWITWRGGELKGRLSCDDEVQKVMKAPHIRGGVILAWRRGELRGAHPSDTSVGDALAVPTQDEIRTARASPAYGFLDVGVAGKDVEARVVFTAVQERAVPRLAFVLLPVS